MSPAPTCLDFGRALAAKASRPARHALRGARGRGPAGLGTRRAGSARARRGDLLLAARGGRSSSELVSRRALPTRCRSITAIAISPAAAEPLGALPFARSVAAERPTRQAVLDEIDRLPPPGVQGPSPMSDTPASPPPRRTDRTPRRPRRGASVVSRPAAWAWSAPSSPGWSPRWSCWPARCLIALLAAGGAHLVARPGRRPARAVSACRATAVTQPSAPVIDTAALDAAKRELTPVSTISTSACAQPPRRPHRSRPPQAAPPPADRPATPDPAIAELQRKLGSPREQAQRSCGIRQRRPLKIRDRGVARGHAIARPGGRRPEGFGRQGRRRGQRQHHRRTESAGRRARLGGDRHRRPHQRRPDVRPALRDRSRPADAAGPGRRQARRADRDAAAHGREAASPRARASPRPFPAIAKAALADDLADDSFGSGCSAS